jgi:hypothetical protein
LWIVYVGVWLNFIRWFYFLASGWIVFLVVLASVWLELVCGFYFWRLVGLVCGSPLGRLVASWLMKGELGAVHEHCCHSVECHFVVRG